MSIATIITHGFGNGTYSGSVADVVTFGYTIGEEVAVSAQGIIMQPRPTLRSMQPRPANRTMVINRG